MKIYEVLLIGFMIGLIAGYIWHYQATNYYMERGMQAQAIMLAD